MGLIMRNTVKRTLAVIICLTMILTLPLAAAPTALAAAPEWTAVGGPGFSASRAYCDKIGFRTLKLIIFKLYCRFVSIDNQ